MTWNQEPGDKREIQVAVLSRHGNFHGFDEDSEQGLFLGLSNSIGDTAHEWHH